VAETVDGLELVPDEEDLLASDEVDELTLEQVRILELVDEQRTEAPASRVADTFVSLEQVAGNELKILEVERRLHRLCLAVGLVEGRQELLEQRPVAGGELLERGAFDGGKHLVVAGEALALWPRNAELRQVEQPLRRRALGAVRAHEVDGVFDLRPFVQRWMRELERLGGDLAQLVDGVGERRVGIGGKPERATRRAEALEDGRQHALQASGSVCGEQTKMLGLARGREARQRGVEGLGSEHAGLALVEHTEAWIEAGLERMAAEQPVAEAVDGRDPSAVELPRQVEPVEGAQPLADAATQLACRPLCVRDDEDRVDVEAALAHRLDEALDEHGRLAGARSRGDEDDTGLLDRGKLLLARSPERGMRCPYRCADAHDRLTRHIVQSSHQSGQSPPRGLWLTSPTRMPATAARAWSRAASTRAQKSSSSR